MRAGKGMPELDELQEMEQPCKDGSTVRTEVVTTIRFDPQIGRPEVLGLTRDITARKAAEAALKRLSDLDNRKEIDDKNRHASGDRAPAAFAQALGSASLRDRREQRHRLVGREHGVRRDPWLRRSGPRGRSACPRSIPPLPDLPAAANGQPGVVFSVVMSIRLAGSIEW